MGILQLSDRPMAAGASPGRIDRRPARAAAADAVGHTEVAWPRGLPCDLFVRAIVEREGFMRSGGVVIGGGTTRLIAYRYRRGANDATDATRPGPMRRGSRSGSSGTARSQGPGPTQSSSP